MHSEEGEISDDSVDKYTPLERPLNYGRKNETNDDVDDDTSTSTTTSDSDSDSNDKPKKMAKMKIKRQSIKHLPPKKYDIWTKNLEEDILSETLIGCDVTKKDRSRNVESYDYPLCERRKRTRHDRNNPHLKLIGRSDDGQAANRGAARIICDLIRTVTSESVDLARDIAVKLHEEKEDLILRVVDVIGNEKSINIFEKTQKIEADGGMLIMNQTRRRTPGGVFLFLIRQDDMITKIEKNLIFMDDKEKFKIAIRNKQKDKYKQMKLQQQQNVPEKLLPDLLTRMVGNTDDANTSTNTKAKNLLNDELIVTNPPPTPETDGLDNSGDGIYDNSTRKLTNYDDDFIELHCINDMDLL